jgi:fatty aldehyde decarbonylase
MDRPSLALVVSGAIAGELVAVDNYCEMVPLIADVELKLRTLEQVRTEALHVTQLTSLFRSFGDAAAAPAPDPRWKRLRRDFSAAVKRADLAACNIIQDLMLPTMGIVLYRALACDTVAAPVAQRILHDQSTHLDQGIAHVRALLRRDPKAVHNSLAWANRRAMPGLVGLVSAGCHALCAASALRGDEVDDSEAAAAELEGLRADALDAYWDTLDRAGFDEKSTLPLIAGIAGDGTRLRVDRGLRIAPVLVGEKAS